MIRIYLICFFFLVTSLNAQTNLFVALTTNEADEPNLVESFIEGYESSGKVWGGNIKIDSFITVSDILNEVAPYCLDNNYNIITFSSGVYGNPYFANLFSPFYFDSVQFVDCAGSNQYRHQVNTRTIDNYISVGAGYIGNATGYNCEFYTLDPFANESAIDWIMRGDTSYTISSITRITDSTIRISVAGLTDVIGYGFEVGVPIRITGLAGTDITPLPPDSLYYLTGANNTGSGRLLLNFRTTSGTLGSNQTPDAGTFKTGTADTNILIRTTTPVGTVNAGITLYDISGYSNNPNVPIKVLHITDQNLRKFEVAWDDLGTGKYISGGKARFDTQSYSHAAFAGMLSAVKDSLGCSWFEARYRLRMTASGNGEYDTYSGYGLPDIAAAIAYGGVIPDEDPYNTLGTAGELTYTRSGSTLIMNAPPVTNALTYEVFRNNTLLEVTLNEDGDFSTTAIPTPRNHPARYWYRATRGEQRSESPVITIPYFYYRKLKIQD